MELSADCQYQFHVSPRALYRSHHNRFKYSEFVQKDMWMLCHCPDLWLLRVCPLHSTLRYWACQRLYSSLYTCISIASMYWRRDLLIVENEKSCNIYKLRLSTILNHFAKNKIVKSFRTPPDLNYTAKYR